MRLDKYLTQSHIGTRKKVHGILLDKKISVNGQIVTDATVEVHPESDEVFCDGKKVIHEGSVCYMFNKPKGCVTARSDEKDKTVLSYFSEVKTDGLFMIGRLDKDTEGLLLLTNDGALDHRLMDPECHVDKTYFFWAVGELSEEDVERIEAGVDIQSKLSVLQKGKSDLELLSEQTDIKKQNGSYEQESKVCKSTQMTKPARLKKLKQGMYHEFADEIPVKLHDAKVVSGLLTISEGKKHQVRRMLRSANCRIFQLKRVAIGNLQLDENLKPGEYRRLSDEELSLLY